MASLCFQQRKRTSSAEAEIVKKKGRPRNSLKTLKFESTKQVQKNEDEGSRDNGNLLPLFFILFRFI